MADAWFVNPHNKLATLARQMDVYKRELDACGKLFPAEFPMAREVFVARSRDEAIRLARPSLEVKYKAYRDWGQDKVMPASDHFDLDFAELIEDRFLLGSPAEVTEQILDLRRRFGVTAEEIISANPRAVLRRPVCDDRSERLLPNGEVLLAGGNSGAGPLASVEVYNPLQGSHIVGSLTTARQWHSAVLLANGKVLIAGGNANASGHWDIQTGYLASAEVYDPATNISTSAATMSASRSMASAVALWTGEVLVAGGGTISADLYCPAMPGTPGMLSISSPISAIKSTIWSGATP